MALIGGTLDAKVVYLNSNGERRLTVRMADGTQHDICRRPDYNMDLWSAAQAVQEILLALGYNAGLEAH